MSRIAVLASALAAWLTFACGNTYWADAPASYRHEALHVGEVRAGVSARSVGLADAGRAGTYGADATVNNPAALANLTGPALSLGGGYWSRALNSQPSPEDLRAQSYYGSFAPTYAAAAYPLAPKRLAVAAAAWVPTDYAYYLGGGGSGTIASRGALYALSPAVAAKIGPAAIGVGGDALIGAQHLQTPAATPRDLSARGYDLRASAALDHEIKPGWKWAACAFGRLGQQLRFTGDRAFNLEVGPAAGGAFTLKAESVNVHLDYVYTFYNRSRSDDAELTRTLAATTRDVGWAFAAAEYVTAGGAIVRSGVAYRPWYIKSGEHHDTKSLRYGMGAGLPTAERHGRLDAALSYGRRAALDVDGYYVDEIEGALSYNYFW